MKKLALILVVALSFVTLSGCSLFQPKEEVFTGGGITITLNDSFTKQETVQWSLYVASLNDIFMGQRELKTDAVSVGVDSLLEYIQLVLTNGGQASATIYESTDKGYRYAYYTAIVDEIEYGYMLVCKEGVNHYYVMNFACLNTNLEENKSQYINWANTIIVE